MGVETNHSHLVTSACTPLLSLGTFSPKESEAPVSASRLRDRKLPLHVLDRTRAVLCAPPSRS